jgi:hypothetical protein
MMTEKLAIENGNTVDNCSSCMYSRFEKLQDDQGACQCNPPQIITVPGAHPITKQMIININSMFPNIRRIDWCGAHEPAIDENHSN